MFNAAQVIFCGPQCREARGYQPNFAHRYCIAFCDKGAPKLGTLNVGAGQPIVEYLHCSVLQCLGPADEPVAVGAFDRHIE